IYNEDQPFGVKETIITLTYAITAVTFEITVLNNQVTLWYFDQIEVFKGYLDDSAILKKNNVSVMFLLDSWGSFPTLEGAETSDTRPDGTSLGGLAYFPNEVGSYLSSLGFTGVNIYNFSRGGATSAWGDYWLDDLVALCPTKPDYCVVNFYINDVYSQGNVAGSTP